MTHTYVILEVAPPFFAFVEESMRRAGYDHAIHKDGSGVPTLDMHGIGLQANPNIPVGVENASSVLQSIAKSELKADLRKLHALAVAVARENGATEEELAAVQLPPVAKPTTFNTGTVYTMKDGRMGIYIRNHPNDGALHIFNEVDREDDDIMHFFAVEEEQVIRG